MANPQEISQLKETVTMLTHSPGVYRMLNADGKVLYIGKARDLKKRVGSYFNESRLSHRVKSFMAQTTHIDTTVTDSEAEALLLESNLIKKYLPRYNVLLRDDKSYPYIRISADAYPRISFYRGSRKTAGQYFGPYPNSSAVREALNLIQKLFKLRQCENSVFHNRSRPCLQYQIKRCNAPCVGFTNHDDYHAQLGLAVELLSGNSRKVIETLIQKMEAASQSKAYEDAAHCRDQIALLRQISEQQSVSNDGGDSDIIACQLQEHTACVQVFNIRDGINIGNKSFYPQLPAGTISVAMILRAFVGQYYLSHLIPREIILNQAPDEQEVLCSMLEHKAGHKVKLTTTATGKKRRCLMLADKNAKISLTTRMLSRKSIEQRLHRLKESLDLKEVPQRLECFDVSHTMGEKTVASCVVFDSKGPNKQQYRRFNISGITPGDDCAALRQAVTRRYQRIKLGEVEMPDILFIDGGKAQTSEVKAVLKQLNIFDLEVIGVSKGAARKAGEETLIYGDFGETMKLAADSPALHLIQQIRDEAHRFAITSHRQQRAKSRTQSVLQNIPSIGPKRRQDLLKYFGGIRAIESASVNEIKKVPGISQNLAEIVYETMHKEKAG